MVEETEGFIRDGYTTFKMKIATDFGASLDHDLKRIAEVRRMIGDKAELAIDANQLWKADDALHFIERAKEHGLGNQIEGYYEKAMKVVVVEDLISTGGSSLSAVKALREAGCEVLGMVAIFTYEFKKAADAFATENCRLDTLSNYSTLIEAAVKSGYIGQSEVETLKKWRLDPASWS
jgi:orotate phosphoribosyltransferase